MREHYILNADHSVQPAELMEWARWFEKNGERRRVDATELPEGVLVSTVFLGLDHSFGDGPPLIFETMAFQNGEEALCWRYSTWNDAKLGHDRAVELIRQYQGVNRSLADLYSEDQPEPPEQPE